MSSIKSLYVCVIFPFILDVRLVDVPAGVTQEEGHTGFLIHLPFAVLALIFLARRIQPSHSLVDSEVEFCVQCNLWCTKKQSVINIGMALRKRLPPQNSLFESYREKVHDDKDNTLSVGKGKSGSINCIYYLRLTTTTGSVQRKM